MAVVDPKGEYRHLADQLGLTTVRLTPGGTTRINPLAPGPAAGHEPEDKQVLRRAEMCVALLATVLERPLNQLEDAAVFAAIEHLTRSPLDEPTLVDVAQLIADPTDEMANRLRRPPDELATDVSQVAYALDKRAAAAEGWRLSEGSLLALGLACGWPGAVIAQQVVRHKTVKMSFQVVFWITVVVNVVAFVVFSWVATLATPDAAPALPLLP